MAATNAGCFIVYSTYSAERNPEKKWFLNSRLKKSLDLSGANDGVEPTTYQLQMLGKNQGKTRAYPLDVQFNHLALLVNTL